MDFAQSFLNQYHAFDRFKGVRRDLISFFVGVALITVGAILGTALAPIIILSGFASLCIAFGFLVGAVIKSSRTETAYYQLLKEELWMPILNMTDPLKAVGLSGEAPPFNDFLLGFVCQKGSISQVYYTLTYKQVSLTALMVSHTTSTGQGSSQTVDFRGYVLKRPTSLVESFRVKKDRTPKWVKPLKDTIQPDTDGSDEFHVEGSPPLNWEAFMQEWDSLRFKHGAWGISGGMTYLALSEFKVIPKIIRRPGTLVATHQAHLMKLYTVMKTFDAWIQNFEDSNA